MKQKEENRKNSMDWQNAAEAELNSSEWFGAIVRYLWHLGSRDFKTFYNQKELKKNAIIGNVIKVLVVIIVVLFGIKYYYG